MRLVIKTVFLYLTIASFFSCDKDMNVEYVYAQTYCADPWDNIPQNTMELFDSQVNFENYMSAEGVDYSTYSFEQENEAEQCEACSCLTGFIFRITASDEFETELLNLGFIASE